MIDIEESILDERKAEVIEMLKGRFSTEVGKKVKLRGAIFSKHNSINGKIYTIKDHEIAIDDFVDVRTGKQTAMFSIRLKLKDLASRHRWSIKFPVRLKLNEQLVIFPDKGMLENYFEDGSLL